AAQQLVAEMLDDAIGGHDGVGAGADDAVEHGAGILEAGQHAEGARVIHRDDDAAVAEGEPSHDPSVRCGAPMRSYSGVRTILSSDGRSAASAPARPSGAA